MVKFWLCFLVVLPTLISNSAKAEDKYLGPRPVSIKVTPGEIDVSENAKFASVELHLTDSVGIRSAIAYYRRQDGLNGGGKVSFQFCSPSPYDCFMTGKLILPKKYPPGVYLLDHLAITNALNQQANIGFWGTSITVINNGGDSDPNEIAKLPDGVKMEDYLSVEAVGLYLNSVKLLDASNRAISYNTKDARSSGVRVPSFPEPPSRLFSLTGQPDKDLGAIGIFAEAVSDFKTKVDEILSRLEKQIEVAKSKKPTTIWCSKNSLIKKVTGMKPVCPKGYN